MAATCNNFPYPAMIDCRYFYSIPRFDETVSLLPRGGMKMPQEFRARIFVSPEIGKTIPARD
jgi:hypothetical protein